MSKPRYKYTLLERLRRLPVNEYEIAMRWIPERLNIHKQTLRRWIYLKSDEKLEIPGMSLILLASFFETDVVSLFSIPPDKIELIESWEAYKEENLVTV